LPRTRTSHLGTMGAPYPALAGVSLVMRSKTTRVHRNLRCFDHRGERRIGDALANAEVVLPAFPTIQAYLGNVLGTVPDLCCETPTHNGSRTEEGQCHCSWTCTTTCQPERKRTTWPPPTE